MLCLLNSIRAIQGREGRVNGIVEPTNVRLDHLAQIERKWNESLKLFAPKMKRFSSNNQNRFVVWYHKVSIKHQEANGKK